MSGPTGQGTPTKSVALIRPDCTFDGLKSEVRNALIKLNDVFVDHQHMMPAEAKANFTLCFSHIKSTTDAGLKRHSHHKIWDLCYNSKKMDFGWIPWLAMRVLHYDVLDANQRKENKFLGSRMGKDIQKMYENAGFNVFEAVWPDTQLAKKDEPRPSAGPKAARSGDTQSTLQPTAPNGSRPSRHTEPKDYSMDEYYKRNLPSDATGENKSLTDAARIKRLKRASTSMISGTMSQPATTSEAPVVNLPPPNSPSPTPRANSQNTQSDLSFQDSANAILQQRLKESKYENQQLQTKLGEAESRIRELEARGKLPERSNQATSVASNNAEDVQESDQNDEQAQAVTASDTTRPSSSFSTGLRQEIMEMVENHMERRLENLTGPQADLVTRNLLNDSVGAIVEPLINRIKALEANSISINDVRAVLGSRIAE